MQRGLFQALLNAPVYLEWTNSDAVPATALCTTTLVAVTLQFPLPVFLITYANLKSSDFISVLPGKRIE